MIAAVVIIPATPKLIPSMIRTVSCVGVIFPVLAGLGEVLGVVVLGVVMITVAEFGFGDAVCAKEGA